MTDPRRQWGNKRHLLVDILAIGLCSTLSSGQDFEDMEDFGNDRIEWLQGFLALPNGIPDSDTFRRVFERLNPVELKNRLINWVSCERVRRGQVCIDGKTIRGSGNQEHEAYHVVSAWANEERLSLGEVETIGKGNEIKAIMQLLSLVDIKGDVVSIDAIGCQTQIAQEIRKKEADYLLALKKNQGNMYEDVEEYFENKQDLPHEGWQGPWEKDHGRIERRHVATAPADWLEGRENWQDIQTVICCTATRIIGEKETITKRYYISSLQASPERFSQLIRGHWSIENHLHWALDVTFGEDSSRVRKNNSPLNLNVLRKIAIPILHAHKVNKLSAKRKMLKAARNPDFLHRLLFEEK